MCAVPARQSRSPTEEVRLVTRTPLKIQALSALVQPYLEGTYSLDNHSCHALSTQPFPA